VRFSQQNNIYSGLEMPLKLFLKRKRTNTAGNVRLDLAKVLLISKRASLLKLLDVIFRETAS